MPDSALFPLPGVCYRLQSVGLVSYLDLYDIYDDKVITRPLHDGVEQQWLFIPADDSFLILNAATNIGGRIKKRYLSIDIQVKATVKCITEGKSPDPIRWRISREAEGIFSISYDADSGDIVFLSIDPSSGKTSYDIQDGSRQINLTSGMKWRIPEAIPSVPKDTYRIRTWLGLAIHVEPKSNVLSVTKLEKKQHEEWEVQPLGNGKCTIKSVASSSFLGWETGNNGVTNAVLKGKFSQDWIVKNVNGGFSITTSDKPLNKTYDLALSNGDTSQLYMKPIKATQNQIWFLEAVNVSLDNSDDGPSQTQTGPSKTALYPEIKNNTKFLFQNRQKDNKGQSRYISLALILYPGPATTVLLSMSDVGLQFDLTYRNTEGNFVLTYSKVRSLVRYGAAAVKMTDSPETGIEWILQRVASTGDLASYYFICEAANQNLVLSGTTHPVTSKYQNGVFTSTDVLTVATKQEGDPTQMWKLLG